MCRSIAATFLVSSLLFGATSDDLFTIAVPSYDLPTVSNGYASFADSLYGRMTVSDPDGSPALPRVRLTYLLAPDADMKTVRITYLDTVARILEGTYDVQPAFTPACACLKAGLASATALVSVTPKDTSVYKANTWYPSTRHTFTTGALGQYKLLDLTFAPYVYNPVKRQLKRMEAGRIHVDFDRIPEAASAHRTDYYENTLLKLIDNDTAVLHEYGEFWPVGAQARLRPSRRFEGLLPVHGGAIALPASCAARANRVVVRTLDGREVFAGTVQGASVHLHSLPGWKILQVSVVPLD